MDTALETVINRDKIRWLHEPLWIEIKCEHFCRNSGGDHWKAQLPTLNRPGSNGPSRQDTSSPKVLSSKHRKYVKYITWGPNGMGGKKFPK